jgi:hypothetical protein
MRMTVIPANCAVQVQNIFRVTPGTLRQVIDILGDVQELLLLR